MSTVVMKVDGAVETAPEKLVRAAGLCRKLLADNEVKLKTKMAHKLIYAVFYGVFNGDLPAYVSIMLLSGRADQLIEEKKEPVQ